MYRISPDGSEAVELINLPSTWIPNVSFGTGLGGWDANTLYIIEREAGSVFGIDLGRPGRPMPFPNADANP